MAVHFNADGGTDDSLTKTVSLFSGSPTSYNWSLVAWCRPNDRHQGTVIGADQGTGSLGRFSLFSRSDGRFAARRKSSYIQTPDADYSDSNTTWLHVAGVWQHGSRALYVNGTEEFSQASNVSLDPAKATEFYIGQDHSGKWWKGGIAEAAAYSVVLTAGEIAMLAAGFSPLMVRPESLIGYWPLGGAYSNDNMDIVGGNTLTTNGGPIAEPHPRIIYPSGGSTFDYAVPVVVEEVAAAERGWMFESMQVGVGAGGRRRLSPPDTRTASTSKGWTLESLQVGVAVSGGRKK
jgi:hypothetical protein